MLRRDKTIDAIYLNRLAPNRTLLATANKRRCNSHTYAFKDKSMLLNTSHIATFETAPGDGADPAVRPAAPEKR